MPAALYRLPRAKKLRRTQPGAGDGSARGKRALLVTGRNTNVKLVEPPSCSSLSAIVFIGKDSRGNWVARQQNGLYGGLFVNRAQALKFALFENGHHPETIVEPSREIELDVDGRFPSDRMQAAARVRRVARRASPPSGLGKPGVKGNPTPAPTGEAKRPRFCSKIPRSRPAEAIHQTENLTTCRRFDELGTGSA